MLPHVHECLANSESELGKMAQEERQRRMSDARAHLKFVTYLCELQHRAGRYFVHEHPLGASSWQENCITLLVRKIGARMTNLDQCMFGLTTTTPTGERMPAKKPTRLLSNMPAISVVMG